MMRTKKFIIKTVVKIFVFAIISTIALSLIKSPVVTNQIAMGQMQNDDIAFIIMNNYNRLSAIITVAYGVITLGFIGKIAYDSYTFIKTKEKKENEEN